MKKPLFFFLAFILTNAISAQMPSIFSVDNAVKFQKLQIDVKIAGNIASSTWTMTFVNNANRVMEGNLTFPLGEGVAVDKYAIDINGKMRNAVPVEKAKATTVFEDISRRRVDPGILEKVEGNSFRTRIYPINGNNGTRIVSIGFNEELLFEGDVLKMNIPLAFKEQLNEFTLNIDVIENALPPEIRSSEQLVFDKVEQSYRLSKTYANYTPDKPLTIYIPKKQGVPEVAVEKIGNEFFFLANVMIKGERKAKSAPAHITLLWDQSLSGEERNIDKEISLLDAYFKHIRNVKVRLIGFSNDIIQDKNYKVTDGDWQDLHDRLKSTIYDGATNYASLELKKYKTNEFLLFSDGLANFIGEEMQVGKTPVYSIASSPKSNFATMKSIAAKSKGEFINLNELDTNQAINLLTFRTFKFLGVKNQSSGGKTVMASNVNEFYPSIPTVVSNNLLLAGCISGLNQQITLQFGYNNAVTEERTITIDGQTNNNIDIQRIWAAKKIDELDLNYEKNKPEIESLGKKFGIVTRNTSLMVLEEVTDYIRYNIDPPAELQEEYDRLRGRTPNNTANFENSTFNLSYLTGRLDKWYNFERTAIQKNRPSTKSKNKFTPPIMIEDGEIVYSEMQSLIAEEATLDEVVVLGYAAEKKQNITGSVATIKQEELAEVASSKLNNVAADIVAGVEVTDAKETTAEMTQPTTGFRVHKSGDEAYINELENSPNAYYAYLLCREKYRTSTKFYFDVAQFFIDRKETALALRVLSNIAELDQENYELYKGLGYKLKAMGQYHAASYAFRKVLDWRPMEPQPYRDYGLSLADEGKHQEALDVLTEGMTRKYASNIPSIFNGVQEIFFTDINGLVMKHPKLKVNDEIKEYIKPVDAEVRVILSWNLADSYIDLHITDPNNEKCDYRNLTTRTGGQFSTDFSGGYGPREFIQRKAVKGKYLIQTNYYGDSIQKIAGPAMILVEIYRDFGTSKETRELIAIHPSTLHGNMFDIGELIFD